MTKNCTTNPQNTSVGCCIILFRRRTAKEVPCSPHCQTNTPSASASTSSAHIHPSRESGQLLTSHISWFLDRDLHMNDYNPAHHCHPKLPTCPAKTSSRAGSQPAPLPGPSPAIQDTARRQRLSQGFVKLSMS